VCVSVLFLAGVLIKLSSFPDCCTTLLPGLSVLRMYPARAGLGRASDLLPFVAKFSFPLFSGGSPGSTDRKFFVSQLGHGETLCVILFREGIFCFPRFS